MLLDNPAAVRRVAMDLLARREHGRVELTRKLRQRGATLDLIDPALDRLTEQGLLCEARYLEAFIGYRARSGSGPLRIREQLLQRGLPRTAIDQALRDSGIDWRAHLHDTWRRKFAGELPLDALEYGQQARFLSYRGYAPEQIGALLRGVFDDD